MINKEFILCAAIYVNDGLKHAQQPENITIGFVVCGRRHSDCFQTIFNLVGERNAYFDNFNIPEDGWRKYQGFMTSLNRYVDRKEAWVIAKENNQIQFGLSASENGEESILISENLY